MVMTETELEGGAYEQRYTIAFGPKTLMEFVRRPVSILPEEGAICFVDNGPRHGAITRQTAGVFKGGKWTRVPFEPTHWTHWA